MRTIQRHKNCLDIDVEIVKITYSGSNYIKVKVRYLDRVNGFYYNTKPQVVKIYRKNFGDWNKNVCPY